MEDQSQIVLELWIDLPGRSMPIALYRSLRFIPLQSKVR
jgi:hypothetical protein